MKYFSTLPNIVTSDNNNNAIVLKNLLARASVISDVFNKETLFYPYDIQEGDTPEIIAHKYYGDMYRYWIVLMANNILDPQWDWPMSGSVFSEYMTQKYGMASGDIHHYEKIITQYDHSTLTTTTNTVTISEEEYNLPVENPATYTFPSGSVSISTEKNSVSNFEYEMVVNESKRSIKLLNKQYANEFENQFKKIMK